MGAWKCNSPAFNKFMTNRRRRTRRLTNRQVNRPSNQPTEGHDCPSKSCKHRIVMVLGLWKAALNRQCKV